jgi:ABC-type transport system involved in cytochrome c biogenesis permease subunit
MKRARVKAAPPPNPEKRLRFLPHAVLGLAVLYWLAGFVPPKSELPIDVNSFAQLPALNGGRVKPLDTIARTSLLVLSGKQTLSLESGRKSAIEWLMDVMFMPQVASTYPVFEIDDPDVLGVMGIAQTNQRRFTYADLKPHLQTIAHQATEAEQVKSDQHSRYQSAILNLQNGIVLYQRLRNTLQVAGDENLVRSLQSFEQRPSKETLARYHFLSQVAEFAPLPVRHGFTRRHDWWSIGTAVLERLQSDAFHPGVVAYAAMGDAYRGTEPTAFNMALAEYRKWLSQKVPAEFSRCRYEWIFNYTEPFYKAMVLYLLVFLLACASWLVYPKTLNRAAYYLLPFAFGVHTIGLVSRMILQGRPPVTNLYSSAIFVGWVAVVLGMILERLYRNGIGSAMSSAIGFITLIIAHHLASQGDTLEMMRAVLDSNFWLATHVVCITIGYGSTFLAGFLGVLYIFRERFDPHWNEKTAATLERMVYGIVCFATFFSFLGTILGGIWADQSWGRFWGWDPKENGALMIVLWNVFILHAHWGGLAKRKTLMAMAVFGNVVTSLSWFGVNMLGIGLHSYGFMDKAFYWLSVFVISQLMLIAFAFYPNKLK